MSAVRADEVTQSAVPIIVLDIDESTTSAPHLVAGRVVLCEENVRLTGDHVPFIVAALRRPATIASVSE